MIFTKYFQNIVAVFFLLSFTNGFSQQGNVHLYGKIISNGAPLQDVVVRLASTSFMAQTDQKGRYAIIVPQGMYQMVVASPNYQTKKIKIDLQRKTEYKCDVTLDLKAPISLKEVAIKRKSSRQKVKESAFNVVALEAKPLHNSTLDLAHLLDKSSGIKIRETGGVGSDMSISFNGFSGKHIKLFMDGVPMQGFGTAFQLNNIPVGIADRIEVYKGVVPVELGADALGGAINIVTNQRNHTFMDLSYAIGSFNTHKTNLNFGFTDANGFTLQLNAFQNYSDNNYKVFIEDILDVNTGTYSIHNKWVERFHDTYHNETVVLKTGFVKKKWADRFLIGVTFGQEYADIQTANMMKIVFGKKFRTSHTIMPTLNYEKRNLFVKGLNFRLSATYNQNKNSNNDTINRQYNWLGDYRVTGSAGESGNGTLVSYYNNNYSTAANLNYRLDAKNTFSLNNVLTGYNRKNEIENTNPELGVAYENMARISQKNVVGLSYRHKFNQSLNFDVFGKNYEQNIKGPVNTGDVSSPSFIAVEKGYNATGYGIATTYFYKTLQFKASVEKAFRMPTENELFGDEVLETGNAALKAENSMNYNFGITLKKEFASHHTVYTDLNFYYRDTQDYIRRIIEQRNGTASSTNHGMVRNMGVDAEARYSFKNKFSIGANVTYQDLRDKERFVASTSGERESLTYNIRIPNVPYFFGNLDASYHFHDLWRKGNVLSLNYAMNFVGDFFLNWENLGSSNSKLILPQQLSHDFNVTFSAANGKYNIALEARNLTNELLYDNYALQKPGRNFSVKLRYFIMDKRK